MYTLCTLNSVFPMCNTEHNLFGPKNHAFTKDPGKNSTSLFCMLHISVSFS